jgi:multiple antibiotic resistance protein
MRQVLTLFISTFSTLLGIINPLEALPVFLKLLEGEDANQHQQVARRSCLYAMLLLILLLGFRNAHTTKIRMHCAASPNGAMSALGHRRT